jgi:hypothetical protein
MIKQCHKCKLELSVDNFYKQSKAPDGLHRWCKNCCKQYRAKSIQRERERQKLWTLKNKEKRLIQNRAAYWRNREKIRLSRKIWSSENREIVSIRWREWAKDNKDYLKAKKAERKARVLKNGGYFTKEEWVHLKDKFDNKCLACGKSEKETKITPDHVVPLVKGGTSYIDNIQPLCRSCNCSKRAEIIDYRNGQYATGI